MEIEIGGIIMMNKTIDKIKTAMRRKRKFIMEKNGIYLYAEMINDSNGVSYRVFNGKGMESYSKECFESAFLPYKAIRPSTFLRIANDYLIPYRGMDYMADKLCRKLERDTCTVPDLINMTIFNDINVRPNRRSRDHTAEYDYLTDLGYLDEEYADIISEEDISGGYAKEKTDAISHADINDNALRRVYSKI